MVPPRPRDNGLSGAGIATWELYYTQGTTKWELYYPQHDTSGNYITPNTTIQFSNPPLLIPAFISFPTPSVCEVIYYVLSSVHFTTYVHYRPFKGINMSTVSGVSPLQGFRSTKVRSTIIRSTSLLVIVQLY